MSEKQNISNDGPAHKYFHMMLNIADDDLDPFEYRLLGHFVRVTNGGETLCEEGIRTTAAITRMSVNKVRAARVSLRMKGYITLTEPTKEETQKGIPTIVKLLDRWADNVARYSKKPVSNSTQDKPGGVSNITQVKPEPVLNMTQGGVSNLTPKKNQESEDVEKKEDIEAKASKPPTSKTLIHNALVEAFGLKVDSITRTADTLYWVTASELDAIHFPPERVKGLYVYVADMAEAEDWTGFTVKALAKYAPDYLRDCPVLVVKPAAPPSDPAPDNIISPEQQAEARRLFQQMQEALR